MTLESRFREGYLHDRQGKMLTQTINVVTCRNCAADNKDPFTPSESVSVYFNVERVCIHHWCQWVNSLGVIGIYKGCHACHVLDTD